MTSGDTKKPANLLTLVSPTLDNLSGFEAALAVGWSPDPRRARDQAYIDAQLQALRQDRSKFLAGLTKQGDTPGRRNGSGVLPLIHRLFWIWDGEFCGTISLRFQPGTEDLPTQVSGHVGYSVVPWKQRHGYATEALKLLLAVAGNEGLSRLVILCNEDNHASRRVIERNGGELFMKGPHPSDKPDQSKLYFWVRPLGGV